jgi:hypothetical protein
VLAMRKGATEKHRYDGGPHGPTWSPLGFRMWEGIARAVALVSARSRNR